jgi:hypothetical protein
MKFKFFLLLSISLIGGIQAQTSDIKDIQIARQKLRVGPDTDKYFTSITQAITSGSTHRQIPTAKAGIDVDTLEYSADGSPWYGVEEAASSSGVKSWDGILMSNVKTINSVTKAGIKTINGITI